MFGVCQSSPKQAGETTFSGSLQTFWLVLCFGEGLKSVGFRISTWYCKQTEEHPVVWVHKKKQNISKSKLQTPFVFLLVKKHQKPWFFGISFVGLFIFFYKAGCFGVFLRRTPLFLKAPEVDPAKVGRGDSWGFPVFPRVPWPGCYMAMGQKENP